MDVLQQWSLDLIRALQTMSPALDGAMNLFSFFGRIEFYLIVLPLAYWTIDHRLGVRILLVLILTDFLGVACKLLFHQPRPYWIGGVQNLAEESSYGIPSTHASDSLGVWGYLSLRLNKAWLWVSAGLLVFLIGLSRLYLGVHFLHDVTFGWLIGAAVIWLFVSGEARFGPWFGRLSPGGQIGLGFAASIALILVNQVLQAYLTGITDPPQWAQFAVNAHPGSYAYTLGGALFGTVAGYILMRRAAAFENAAGWARKAGRFLVGIAGVLVIYFGLDWAFSLLAPDEAPLGYFLRYARYAVVTFWVTFLAPWIFLRIGLAGRSDRALAKT
jgi:membrane-associated phospholipid phosphatase